ncbi:hypothetical protein SEUCBS139899_009684 [Sporothrix eucalyptigena]|uniref:WSC domain-containing protein n=1 Tax=Sporothrix eucalyptigena TaxID=1812306 RepID=A0ABP0CYC1_9PEZI
MAKKMMLATALAGLALPLIRQVKAHGYYGGDEHAACGDDYLFRYIGCYDADLINGDDSTFILSIGTYNPADPQFNYVNPFPGYVSNTNYNDTVTPPQASPPSAATSTSCTEPCDGDSTQTCGGSLIGSNTVGAAQVYGDPSFADPLSLQSYPPGYLDSYYKYLGCYYKSNFGPQDALENGVIESCQTTYTDCASHCSDYGYSLAAVEYSPSGSSASLCTADCDPSTEKCCGSDSFYPVYINSELTGCYQPQIPGYGDLDGLTLTGYTCAADPAADLIGGPKVVPAGSTYYDDKDFIETVVPNHPVNVPSSDDAPYDEYYIMGCYSALMVSTIFSDGVQATSEVQNGLHYCAEQCGASSYSYFAVGGGGVDCYCGNTLANGATPRNMASCNNPCSGNPSQNCGGAIGPGPGFSIPVVYAVADVWENSPVYSSMFTTLVATPLPTYTCTPAPSASSSSSSDSSSSSGSSSSISSSNASSSSASSSASSSSVSSSSSTSALSSASSSAYSSSASSSSSTSLASSSQRSSSASSASLTSSASSASSTSALPRRLAPLPHLPHIHQHPSSSTTTSHARSTLMLPNGLYFLDDLPAPFTAYTCHVVTRSWVPGKTTLLPEASSTPSHQQ